MAKSIKLMGCIALFVVVALSSCSSKKYDSWSECISAESQKNDEWAVTSVYCDSNYDMTDREQEVRQNAYCSYASNELKPECNPTVSKPDTSNSGVTDGAALNGNPVPFDKLPDELRVGGQPGPWSKYLDEEPNPSASLEEAQDAARAAADAADEAAANQGGY